MQNNAGDFFLSKMDVEEMDSSPIGILLDVCIDIP